MSIVAKKLFADNIQVGQIYYLKKHKLITSEPHYFIVVGKSDTELVLFSCFTSNFESRRRYIELKKLPFTTLVQVKHNKENNLKQESYVDCNSVYDHPIGDLYDLNKKGLMTLVGNLNDGKLEEIKVGIAESPLVPGELKDIVAES